MVASELSKGLVRAAHGPPGDNVSGEDSSSTVATKLADVGDRQDPAGVLDASIAKN